MEGAKTGPSDPPVARELAPVAQKLRVPARAEMAPEDMNAQEYDEANVNSMAGRNL